MASIRRSACRRWGAPGRMPIGLVVAVCLGCGAALADDPPKRIDFGKLPPGFSLRIDERRLSPRVAAEMESLSAFESMTGPAGAIEDHVMLDEMTDTVRRRAKSVTRRALRDHLFRAIRLDRGIDSVRGSIRGSGETRSDMSFHFGVHSMLPEVGMRVRLRTGGSLGFNVGADGEVGLRFNADRLERANLSVGFDGEDTYQVRALFSF